MEKTSEAAQNYNSNQSQKQQPDDQVKRKNSTSSIPNSVFPKHAQGIQFLSQRDTNVRNLKEKLRYEQWQNLKSIAIRVRLYYE